MMGTFSLVKGDNYTVRVMIVILTVFWELGQSSEFLSGRKPHSGGVNIELDFVGSIRFSVCFYWLVGRWAVRMGKALKAEGTICNICMW